MAKQNSDRDAIVSTARAIASKSEAAAYITEVCGDDDELKHQVEEQVEAQSPDVSHEEPNRASDAATPSAAPSKASHANNGEQRITRIGPYKVLKQIGEGAASIVFEAEQQDPVPLKVALKVIKDALDWRQIALRFEAERQALSRLEHPHIAKVIGAGTRQSGQPYFVMELVEGLPITKYCEEHQQPLKQRLELFISVCQAVGHAHQKGVIHGNLKPSNVLVSDHEGNPTPKILDFGVAQAIRHKPNESAPSTGPGTLGDKPEYLSPEQADPDNADIDTRSDVYDLGVLLYELVTGTTPLMGERLKDIPKTETLRLIREEQAPSLSTRLNESKERLASVAAKRQMKPDALVKAAKDDLECVVAKALQKDRTHRYETVNELARDLQRYLAKEPVEAECPHGRKFRLRTMARQHPRVAMAVGAILVLLLLAAVGGVGLAVWEGWEENKARKAEHQAVEKQNKAEEELKKTKGKLKRAVEEEKNRTKERDRAQEAERAARHEEEEVKGILDFLKHKLLAAGRPGDVSLADAFWAGSQGKDVTVRKNMTLRKAVDEAEAKTAQTFADKPVAEATVREMLGLAYLTLGAAEQAVKQYERAFELRQAEQGENASETADCRNQLAVAYRLAGRDTDAAHLYQRNPNSPTRAAALAIRGSILLAEKKPDQAELKLRESLNIREKTQPNSWMTSETKSLLGEALLEQKKFAEAEPLLREGYQGIDKHEEQIPSADRRRVLNKALYRLVRLYEEWGKKDEAAIWWKKLEATGSKEP